MMKIIQQRSKKLRLYSDIRFGFLESRGLRPRLCPFPEAAPPRSEEESSLMKAVSVADKFLCLEREEDESASPLWLDRGGADNRV